MGGTLGKRVYELEARRRDRDAQGMAVSALCASETSLRRYVGPLNDFLAAVCGATPASIDILARFICM